MGVSLSAKASTKVKPAPPTAHGPLSESGLDEESDDNVFINQQGMGGSAGQEDEWIDWADLKKQRDKEEAVKGHDEL